MAHGDTRKRIKKCVELTLSQAAIDELKRRAIPHGNSKSAAVEAWLTAPEKKTKRPENSSQVLLTVPGHRDKVST